MASTLRDSKGLESLPPVDVVIIGGGLGGLYAHRRLRQLGLTLQGFEAAPEVGGTWWFNSYPGARCDVESLDYAYSFSRELLDEWRWSERYATQPEILRYINHVADRFDLRRDILFGVKVTAARFDDRANCWTVETNHRQRISARYLVTTVGCLSTPKPPEFAGLEDFEGRWAQTADWPAEGLDLAGKHVGVVGTGSSGIQVIPEIAKAAAHLTVFQRTPNFTLPACNGPVDPAHEAHVRADYPAHARANRTSRAGVQFRFPPEAGEPGQSALEVEDAARRRTYEALWRFGGASFVGIYSDLMIDLSANGTAADFVRDKIRQIVKDPATAAALSPADYPLGTKRICLDSDYYATFNRPNVALADLRKTPIERITRHGLKTSDKEYPLDVLVFATGFDAVTGPLLQLNLTGAGGLKLTDAWADGPATYLGLMIAGFPNLFTVNGPGSPSVLTNMIPSIEEHVDWIAGCLEHMRVHGFDRIEAEPQAQAAWVVEVRAAADRTLYPRANSWYMGANVEGKPRMFLAYAGGFGPYYTRCAQVAQNGYRGFQLARHGAEAPAALQRV